MRTAALSSAPLPPSGSRFRPDQLARICGVDEHQVIEVLRVAMDRRLVGAVDNGEYAFVHDRVREALLAEVYDSTLRRWHQRIAEVLEASIATAPEHVYAVARHYLRGERGRAPRRLFDACFAAGQLALAQYAPQEALGFLEQANNAAARAGIDPESSFHAALGEAYLLAGRFAESLRALKQALSTESDRNRRAMLHCQIANAYDSRYEADEALAAVRRGLAEVGHPLPRNPLMLVLSTMFLFVAGIIVCRIPRRFGDATGERRERYRLQCWLNGVAADAAAFSRQMLLMTCMVFRQVYPANRLGISLEHVQAYTNLAGILRTLHWNTGSDRLFQRMRRAAAQLGNRRAVAYIAWIHALVVTAMRGNDVESRDTLRRILTEHGRWLMAQEYVEMASNLCTPLTFWGIPTSRWPGTNGYALRCTSRQKRRAATVRSCQAPLAGRCLVATGTRPSN